MRIGSFPIFPLHGEAIGSIEQKEFHCADLDNITALFRKAGDMPAYFSGSLKFRHGNTIREVFL
jgi:hypothetical protein